MSHVHIEPLRRENYDTWRIQARALLTKCGLWSYVSQAIKRPTTAGDDLNKYIERDSLALSELLLIIAPSELKQVKNCKSSKDVWDTLEGIYNSKGPARKATLLKELILRKMKDSDDTVDHLNKFMDIVDKLADMDITINKDLLSIMLLYSLPHSFENFRIAIESRDDLPDPDILKIKIIEEAEARRNVGSTSEENEQQEALYSRQHKKKFTGECYKCKKKGHRANECKSKVNEVKKNNSNLCCSIETCLNTNDIKRKNVNTWCLDSGCTSHMSYEKERFRTLQKDSCKPLKLASENYTAPVEGRGPIKLNIRDLLLTEALYVPSLTTNLMSVGKMTDKGATVLFRKEHATVMLDGVILMKAVRNDDGLYYVQENMEQANICENSKMELWHRKLGHLNETQMKIALEKKNIEGLEFDKRDTVKNCEVCIKGKFTKLPYNEPRNMDRTREPLEIVHSDVCGPIRQPSVAGSKYFITFTDDFTRYGRVYTMKSKSECLSKFKEYKNEAENYTKRKIQNLQSDNGTEYINHEFDNYLKENGIKRRLSAPYTPEQNGLAERKNRTLLDKARCMLIDARMPERFWAEAVYTANYLANRSPCSSIDNMTPFEKWVKRIPKIRHFHIFGCKAFVLKKGKKKRKFEARSTAGIFIGYSENYKAYRVYNPKEDNVIISRDVRVIDKMYYEEEVEHARKDEANTNEIEVLFNENVHHEEMNINDINELDTEIFEDATADSEHTEVIENETPAEQEADTEATTSYHERRQRKPPEWHKDYIMDSEQTLLCEVDENSVEWEDAIKSEIESHLKNNTWKIVHRNQSKNLIDSKLVLKYKYNVDGEVNRRKARLVARGFSQKEGLDYSETFAPVAKMSTIRLLVAHAIENNMKLCQLDVCTAFLNGDIDETIHMKKPTDLEKYLKMIVTEGKNKELVTKAKYMLNDLYKYKNDGVCQLNKAIYGLKQAGRQWYLKLHEKLLEIGFKNAVADPCLYILEKGGEKILMNIYVDDLILAYSSEKLLNNVKSKLQKAFDLRDMGALHHCLGIRFTHVGGEMRLSQKVYIENLIDKFNMTDCKPACTPMELSLKLEKNENKDDRNYPYQKLIGSLMYLAVATRPDIMFAVSYLSQYNTCYGSEHWQAAKRVIRYLKGTKDACMRYKKSGTELVGMADADWAACTVDRRSYTGYVFKYGANLISYETKKQRVVALSTAESEYMSLTEAAKEALHLKQLLEDIGVPQQTVTIYNDNMAAQKMAKNLITGKRSKHISIKEHFIRDCVQQKLITVQYKETENMEADLLTKALPQVSMVKLLDRIGVTPTPRSS